MKGNSAVKDRNLPFTVSLWRGTLGSLKTWLLNKARRTNTYGTWYIYPLQGGQYAFHRQELGPKTRAALAISGDVVVWATARLALVSTHQKVIDRHG